MGIGAILVLGNLVGLLGSGHMETFGSASGNGLAGTELVGLILGIGLIMRKELARRVYLVFAVLGLVLTLLNSSSSASSPGSYLLGLALDLITVGLLVHPRVRDAFD